MLFLLGAAHSANHSLFLVLPQVLILVTTELGISNFTIGIVAMLASILYGVGSLAGGSLSDRIGEMRIVIISLAFSGLSTMALLFANEILVFALGMLLMGGWASLYHPTANALISKAFQQRMGESMAIHGVGGSLGIMFTPLIAQFLGFTLGWRVAFLFFGIVCIVLSLIFLKTQPAPSQMPHPARLNEEDFNWSSVRLLLALNIAIGLYMRGVELFFQTYAISYSFRDMEIEAASFIAASAASVLFAAGVAGQLVGGRATDAFGSKKVLVATSVGVIASLLFLQTIPFPILGVFMFAMLYGLSFYAHQPAMNSLTGKLAPAKKRGVVYGVFFFSIFGIGSLSQSLTGYFADTFGIQSAFSFLTLFALLALFLSFVVPNSRERRLMTESAETKLLRIN